MDGIKQQTTMRQRAQAKRSVAVVESAAGQELAVSEWIEVADNVKRKYELGRRKESRVVGLVLMDTRPAGQKVVDSFLNRFFPLGYPHSVAEGYLTYSKYRAVQHFASAVLSVFSTQSLLFAAGLRPTPAQATIVSWVLKDGMQHIGKFVCSSLGTRMDSEPKRWRIFADVMYDVGAGLEVVAPFCPQYFLAVAGLANMAKGMALVSARATRLPVYSAFAKEGNLSDLYAKGEAISTLSNVLGLGVGIHLASTACASIEAKLLVAPVLSAVHLCCVAQEMRAAPINTLNAQRTALLVADFLRTGRVSEPAQLRHRERLVLPIGLNADAGNVRVGAPLCKALVKPSKLLELKQMFRKERFLLNFHDQCTDLVLHQSATGEDAVRGWLLAACTAKLASTPESPERMSAALDQAYAQVDNLLPSFLSGLKDKGWHTHLFLEGSGIRAVW